MFFGFGFFGVFLQPTEDSIVQAQHGFIQVEILID